MWYQQLSLPELLSSRSLDHSLSHTYTTHPCIQKSNQKKHKHYIYHMRMKITQNKGIAWKFMDCLILQHIRIISDIAGCIREPVTVHFFSLKLLDPWNNLTINNIMHISRNRYGKTGSDSRQRRHISFLSCQISL